MPGRAPARAGTGRCRRPPPGGRRAVDRDMRCPERVRGCSPTSRCPPPAPPRPSWSDRNGYCQPARRSPRNGIVSTSICGSCVAHSAWMLAVADSAAKRGMSSGMHHLQVGQVMPWAAGAVRGPGGLDRVQCVADRAVAERMEVNLEAFTVQRGDEPGQLGRVDEIQPACARWCSRLRPGTAPAWRRCGSRRPRPASSSRWWRGSGPACPGAAPSRTGSSASWSRPRSRSHHRAPTTLAASVPASAARRYAGSLSGAPS